MGGNITMNIEQFTKIINTLMGCTNITITLVAIYGTFFLLPNFVKQKRIENASTGAKDALRSLMNLEEALKKFAFYLKINQPPTASENKELREAEMEVSATLNTLRNNLLLLHENPDVQQLIAWIEKLLTISQENKKEHTRHFISPTLLNELDPRWTEKNTPDFSELERTRATLCAIYKINDRTQY